MSVMRHWLADAPPGVWSQGTAIATDERMADEYRALGWRVSGPFVPEPARGAVEARDVLLTIMREAAGMDAATCRKWIRRAVAASDAERERSST